MPNEFKTRLNSHKVRYLSL